MTPSAKYANLPFDEAIETLRRRGELRLPTATWNDLTRDMHGRAFVVAGAVKDELLSDLFSEVMKGVRDGTTLREFRKNFDDIVRRAGWKYKGGKGWRTATIFNTNLSTTYASGHWKRMTDRDVIKSRPFLRYVASSSRNPRSEHMQWYNLVLPADDPFWQTHTPPNGWGCK
ncbi:MAG: hypothetical protein JXL84_15115 [Deltaproteobacteria bacterium]|nr:hypothetical protein [Deltaproteobacteria bacterium]